MAKLRVEFIRAGKSAGVGLASHGSPVEGPVASASGELDIAGTATAEIDQLVAPGSADLVCRCEAIGDQCYVAIGSPADPTAEPRRWIADGNYRDFAIEAGQKVGCIQATLS